MKQFGNAKKVMTYTKSGGLENRKVHRPLSAALIMGSFYHLRSLKLLVKDFEALGLLSSTMMPEASSVTWTIPQLLPELVKFTFMVTAKDHIESEHPTR